MTAATTVPRPIPLIDHDNAGFFEAARRGELVVRVCRTCDQILHLPREYCFNCGGSDLEWRPTSGKARLYTWTTVTHAIHPAFEVPYTVVLVDLEDAPGIRFTGNVPGTPDLKPDMPMEVWFERVTDEITLPNWRPVQTESV